MTNSAWVSNFGWELSYSWLIWPARGNAVSTSAGVASTFTLAGVVEASAI
jgi:hypothetical protein